MSYPFDTDPPRLPLAEAQTVAAMLRGTPVATAEQVRDYLCFMSYAAYMALGPGNALPPLAHPAAAHATSRISPEAAAQYLTTFAGSGPGATAHTAAASFPWRQILVTVLTTVGPMILQWLTGG
jgi:hypothetical protein